MAVDVTGVVKTAARRWRISGTVSADGCVGAAGVEWAGGPALVVADGKAVRKAGISCRSRWPG